MILKKSPTSRKIRKIVAETTKKRERPQFQYGTFIPQYPTAKKLEDVVKNIPENFDFDISDVKIII